MDEGQLERFRQQAAQDYGVCVAFVAIPFRRSEQMMLDGKLDGDLLRTGTWAEMYAREVVLVPTPSFKSAVVAVSLRERGITVTSLADLKTHRLVFSSGFRWAEQAVLDLGIGAEEVSSLGRYLELLRSGGSDVGLLEKSVLPFLGDVSDMQIQEIEVLNYYLVLQRRHAPLLDALDATLVKTGPFILGSQTSR
ncbi:type 2 periplasmic-binding domain-containing protein [Kordiimonas aestuarii]|uniref:hypothetical protein n=1 Tax=Kordiimonas aestuarii TaxID=1005925 RepID=UPI0021CDFF6B|nr:hypothetical protein [Kordiimonas aestuarii]